MQLIRALKSKMVASVLKSRQSYRKRHANEKLNYLGTEVEAQERTRPMQR